MADAAQHLLLGQGLFCRYLRFRARREMENNGFALIGKDGTPLTSDRIDQLYDAAQITDDMIIAHATKTGVIGDGSFLEWLGKVMDWIVGHQDEILALIKFIMSIIAVFAVA